jgi:AMIN domain
MSDEMQPDVRSKLAMEFRISLSAEVIEEMRQLVREELASAGLELTSIVNITERTQHDFRKGRHCGGCDALVPSVNLFCPKCGTFQGSVATERYRDCETNLDPEKVVPPGPAARITGISQPLKQVRKRIGVAMALAACLTFSVVYARSVNREHHVNQMAPATLSIGANGSKEFSSPIAKNFNMTRDLTTQAKSDDPQRASLITTVNRIEVVPATWGLGVVIMANRSIVPRVTKLEGPPRVAIDLENALLRVRETRIPVESQVVTEVRTSQYQVTPPAVRIVAQLTTPVAFSVKAEGNKCTIWLTPMANEMNKQP